MRLDDTARIFFVQNGELVTTGKVQGCWYTQKKYLNFTLRFDYRHICPPDLDPDDEYYDGNSGYLLFITEHRVWPRGIEIQGNNANMQSAIGMDASIKQVDDNDTRSRNRATSAFNLKASSCTGATSASRRSSRTDFLV